MTECLEIGVSFDPEALEALDLALTVHRGSRGHNNDPDLRRAHEAVRKALTRSQTLLAPVRRSQGETARSKP